MAETMERGERGYTQRVLDAFNDNPTPLTLERLVHFVRVGTRPGEEELTFPTIRNTRNRLVKNGEIVAVSGRRGRLEGTYRVREYVSPEVQGSGARETHKAEPAPELAWALSEPTLRDKLHDQMEEFKAMMDSILAYLEYAVDMERNMKFWMDESSKHGVRWGARRSK